MPTGSSGNDPGRGEHISPAPSIPRPIPTAPMGAGSSEAVVTGTGGQASPLIPDTTPLPDPTVRTPAGPEPILPPLDLAPTVLAPRDELVPLPLPRRPGAPVEPEEVRRFLSMDPSQHFDLVELNSLPLVEMGRRSAGEEELRHRLQEKARELLPRVKQEADELHVTGALVRALLLQWYRESLLRKEWPASMPSRWAGLLADSRSAGGKLQPWLVRRLLTLVQGERSDDIGGRILRHLGRGRAVDHFLERPPAQTWAAEAAQAVLDDLALRPRIETPARLALVRLSELAQRRSVESVNQALSLLLDSPERGPFIVLHPNRYPDCELVAIRAPPPGSTGASLSYQLLLQRVAPSGPAAGELGAATLSTTPGTGEPDLAGGTGDPWEASERTEDSWRSMVQALRAAKQHLPAPPKDYRTRAPYRTLRDLVVKEVSARKDFLAVRWRGRPSGLHLLASLLTEKRLSPEAATDFEYLDSELSDLVDGQPDRVPDPPRWEVPGGRVTREGDFQKGYTYRFDPAGS